MNFTDDQLGRAWRAALRAEMDGRSGIDALRRELVARDLAIQAIEVEDKIYAIDSVSDLQAMQTHIRTLARELRDLRTATKTPPA